MKMGKLLAAFAALILVSVPALATEYHISPSGDDEADCDVNTPCKTFPRVCDAISSGSGARSSILVADGTYTRDPTRSEVCSVVYNNVVTIIGNSASPNSVVIQLTGNDAGFFAQDGAIIALNGVYITSSGSGSIGLETRQFAIADYNKVWFGQLAVDVAASEDSKINCLAATVISNMTYHAMAFGRSTVLLNCPMSIANGVAVSAFVNVAQESFIDASSLAATLYGASSRAVISGQKWINSHSEINGIANLPGAGFTNAGHYEVNF